MRESGLYRQIEFDTMEAFRQAQRLIVRRGRLGGRYLKLDLVRCTNSQAFSFYTVPTSEACSWT